MKIRKVLDKKVGETEYFKYLVTLPKEIVEKSGLIGKELEAKKDDHRIIIEKLSK